MKSRFLTSLSPSPINYELKCRLSKHDHPTRFLNQAFRNMRPNMALTKAFNEPGSTRQTELLRSSLVVRLNGGVGPPSTKGLWECRGEEKFVDFAELLNA